MAYPRLYQYRSASAFLRTINKSSLSLISHKHFNDPEEAKYAFEVYRELLENLKIPETEKSNSNFFITCFSTERDSLPMWRSYADECAGISIGFEFENFSNQGSRFALNKVTYVGTIDEVKDQLEKTCTDIKRESRYQGHMLSSRGSVLLTKLVSKIPLFKRNAFSYENEHRIVLYPTSILPMIDGNTQLSFTEIIKLTKYDDAATQSSWSVEENTIDKEFFPQYNNLAITMGFFEQEKRIVPHIEWTFDKNSIKEIIIGPLCKISKEEINLILACNGFNTSEITITRSNISLRW